MPPECHPGNVNVYCPPAVQAKRKSWLTNLLNCVCKKEPMELTVGKTTCMFQPVNFLVSTVFSVFRSLLNTQLANVISHSRPQCSVRGTELIMGWTSCACKINQMQNYHPATNMEPLFQRYTRPAGISAGLSPSSVCRYSAFIILCGGGFLGYISGFLSGGNPGRSLSPEHCMLDCAVSQVGGPRVYYLILGRANALTGWTDMNTHATNRETQTTEVCQYACIPLYRIDVCYFIVKYFLSTTVYLRIYAQCTIFTSCFLIYWIAVKKSGSTVHCHALTTSPHSVHMTRKQQQKQISKAWVQIKTLKTVLAGVLHHVLIFSQIYLERLVHCSQPKMKFMGVQMKFIGKCW